VARAAGGGRLESDGTFRGTRWTSVGVAPAEGDDEPELHSIPSEPSAAEVLDITALVADVMGRLL
jgi:hypothetical protein